MNETALKYPLVPVVTPDDTPVVPQDRELQYILNLHSGMEHTQAGLEAGYSRGYVDSRLSHKRFKPAFIQRYIEITKCSFAYLVSKILKMDSSYIKKIAQEVSAGEYENYTKSKHTLDRIGKFSGFLKSEETHIQVTYNIGQIQQLIKNRPK